MAQITLSNPIFYRAGQSGMSTVVGVENRMARIVRYDLVAPDTGASHVEFTFTGFSKGNGKFPTRLRAYVGADPNSHANAGPISPYDCILTHSGGAYTGQASMILRPNYHYYVWVFPDADPATSFGWVYWSTRAGTAVITTGGAAATVISGSNGTLGQSNTLTLSRYTSEATHTLTASCGSASMTIAQSVAADTYSWTPPVAWAAQNTTGNSVSVTVTCTTYIGGQTVGSSSVTISMAIPNDIIPTCNLSLSDPTGLSGEFGGYIQGKSTLKATISASGAYGSDIISMEIVWQGTHHRIHDNLTFDLPYAGRYQIIGSVEDSRHRYGSVTLSVDVTAYTQPIANISTVFRCDQLGNEDPAGDYASVIFSASVDPLVGSSAVYAVKQRVRGTTAWESTELPQYSGIPDIKHETVILPADPNTAFDFCITAADRFSKVRESTYRSCQVAFSLIYVQKAIKSIGVGQRAVHENTVAIALPVEFNSPIVSGPVYSLGGVPEWNMIYKGDFNNYLTPGVYAVPSIQDAGNISNMPCQTAGVLIVSSAVGRADFGTAYSYVMQEFKPYSAERPTYRRGAYSDSIPGRWHYENWHSTMLDDMHTIDELKRENEMLKSKVDELYLEKDKINGRETNRD